MAIVEFDAAALIAASVRSISAATGTKLVLAYSGGVDSEILAHGLASYAKQHPEYHYLLVHVHHGLSVNADAWAAHCEMQALHYQLPIDIIHVQVNTGPRLSIEAEARRARYNAIKTVMATGDVLLTAHHVDDQLETVLLALKRGLGPKGLSAMGSVQQFDEDKVLLRPLLSIERAQIEAKAAELTLPHIEDESNGDDTYDRNFLRLEIIPKLKARWGAIATTASRSAALCAQQQDVIDCEVSLRLPDFIEKVIYGKGTALNLTLLSQQTSHWQMLLLRGYVEQLKLPPVSQVQLKQLINQLLLAKSDAKIVLRMGDMLVRRFKDKAYFSSFKQEEFEQMTSLNIEVNLSLMNKQSAIKLPLSLNRCVDVIQSDEHERVRMPDQNEVMTVRFSLLGSTCCHPHNRQQGRPLKKLWAEYGVPPWEREKVPFIFYNNKLVCVVGYWIEKPFVCLDGSTGLLFTVN